MSYIPTNLEKAADKWARLTVAERLHIIQMSGANKFKTLSARYKKCMNYIITNKLV